MTPNLRGMAAMTLGMGAFACADAFIKIVSVTIPSAQIIVMMGAAAMIGFGLAARGAGQPVLSREVWHKAVIARNLGEVLGTFGLVLSLSLIDLSTLAAIIQSNPLLVTLGAALFMGERVGWRRWSAILVGLAGVLIIIRPGTQGFEPETLFAVIGALGLAVRDLASRAVPARISTLQLSCWGFGVLVPLGLVLMLVSGEMPAAMDLRASLLMAAVVIFAAAGLYTVTAAMRIGDVAVVSPFRYTRLIFGISIGMIFFAERPDGATWIGAGIVVATGLYTFVRERRVKSA